ncbi:hypothetical protein H0H93_004042 [Arthromyces matolae]|nr:hypothetical protein H0H93_004042 [Arthromyces matolae]
MTVYTAFFPPTSVPSPDSRPIKIGVIGAANIAPIAIVSPAKNHPETVLYAIAARDKTRAEAFAKTHGFEKAYGGPNGYQGTPLLLRENLLIILMSCEDLLDDPEIDAVYNPDIWIPQFFVPKLPNGLHYEWTMKALAAGKHVLLEKPSANTAEETRNMFDLAEKKGLVLLEAFHYRFHPAIQRVKAIIDSKELGAIKHISASLAVPKGVMKPGDIRFDYSLGGGGLMDMGCYTLNVIRYLSSSNPTAVISAEHNHHVPPGSPTSFKPNVDRGTTATLALPNDITATLYADLRMPFNYGFIPPMPRVSTIITLEGGDIEIYNFPMPTLYHSITVSTKANNNTVKTRVEKVYTFADAKIEGKGEAWWTTYRFQLEAFVDRIKGRTPQTWVDREDSIANMHWIEQIYAKVGHWPR